MNPGHSSSISDVFEVKEGARLLERARAVLRDGWPEMGQGEIRSPVSRYLDVSRHEREFALMRRYPQAVAPADALSLPGSWWSGDVLGIPLLITRDGNDTLHAFLNVCRHRGARVVEPGDGCGRLRFSCPYHAWTYAADGSLLAVPRREAFPELEPQKSGLRRLAVAQRAGIIWVVPDIACAADDIDAHLGEFADELESMGFSDHVPYAPRELDVSCNWKLIVEGGSEAYHVKTAHRPTIAPMFADNAQVVEERGLNRRMYFIKETLRDMQGTADIRLRDAGNFLYYFFPSTIILVHPDHTQVTRLEPLATDRTKLIEFALIPESPQSDRARMHWDRNVQLYRDTLGEDYAQMESIQGGLASGANESLRFGRFETALGRFNEQVEAELAAADARSSPSTPARPGEA